MIKVGFHASIAGGVDKAADRAKERDCHTLQIFTTNPRGWKASALKPDETERFKQKIKQYNISPAVSHMPYLPNLATPNEETYKKSYEALKAELERCKQLEIPYLVTHLGSHLGQGKEQGYKRITEALNKALKETPDNPVTILLENTAGTLHSMGSTFQDIKQIIEKTNNKDRIALCLDTCHAFAAGYDLRTPETIKKTLNQLDQALGIKNIKVIHLNDSKGDLNSGLDRHEHIGLGHIGERGFKALFKFQELRDLPFILETPIDARRDDRGNIEKVRELAEQ